MLEFIWFRKEKLFKSLDLSIQYEQTFEHADIYKQFDMHKP